MSCEEAQLHKERLQALAEKRKRQTEIEDKRNQLDDLVLQLQHVKSKAMRERWLLQGMGVDEEEARRKQLEQDEEQGKRLEDVIQRLESEIGALESEESQISAKEQILRERLKETERSIEDLQKSLKTKDEDATGCSSDPGHPSSEQPVRTGASGEHASSRPGYSASPEVTVTTANGCGPPVMTRHPQTVMQKSWLAEDVSDPVPRERALKSVSFLESVSFITDSPAVMELESQQIQHGRLSSPNNHTYTAAGLKETRDGDVVQEICYLDQVLDAASEAPANGDSFERPKTNSVCVSSPLDHTTEEHMYTSFTHEEHSPIHTNGHAPDDYGQGKPKFELRAFHEEKKPAKLFTPGDEQPVRVTRRRPTEEVQELERERQELIKDQAVKKNPGIAQRWWNPPQEVPLEDQLEAEQLESLRKYQERKQQRQSHPYPYSQPQMSGPTTVVSFDPALGTKDDIVEDQISFSSARQQFLLDNKKDIAPQIYSAKPFSKSPTADSPESHVTWSDEGIGGDFTCARAVMTILPEDDDATKSRFQSSFHPEESDSGLDELSVRSQDTAVFSSDNVSDSGASLPLTPQPTTPINGRICGSPTEEDLEYQAGVLVENAIQNALAAQTGNDWRPSFSDCSAPESPQVTKKPVSSSPLSGSSSDSVQSSVCSSPDVKTQEKASENSQTPSPSEPVSPPPARPRDGGPRIKIQSSYARALAASAPSSAPAATAPAQPVSRPTPVYRPPSPPSPDKPEFSYFSKYSEAAELRSTAAASKGPEAEPASGPFRLRSRKQRTLSMIEDEIRAAQQREEELKKQREVRPAVGVRPSEGRKTTLSPAEKMKSNSLPTRLTLTAKTAPGKIEKVRPAPPVSPSPSEGALSDAGSEDSSGSSRPKNYMQTLMEDYETHKVKRREQMEDSQVLEATRMTRRKNNMALRWEAGIYTNEDGQQIEDDDEEEEEEEE